MVGLGIRQLYHMDMRNQRHYVKAKRDQNINNDDEDLSKGMQDAVSYLHMRSQAFSMTAPCLQTFCSNWKHMCRIGAQIC